MRLLGGLSTMDGNALASLGIYRPTLLERKARLEAAARMAPAAALRKLLDEVDAALERIENGSYGLCESCHDPIEPEGLARNPMARFCIDHLTRAELAAHEEDVQLAAQIQEKLLPPRELQIAEWETGYRYVPAGAVSGDYCELMAAGGGGLFFAVGDIAGKGVAASLLMTHLSAIIRSLASLDLPLAELMQRANGLFCESTGPSHFATLVCGRAAGNRVEVSNAGHCRPLWLRRGTTERLDSSGLPLGLFNGAEYEVREVILDEGEALALFSDGISEAHRDDGEEYGEERLAGVLKRHSGLDADGLAGAALHDVDGFLGTKAAGDDRTVMILRRR